MLNVICFILSVYIWLC